MLCHAASFEVAHDALIHPASFEVTKPLKKKLMRAEVKISSTIANEMDERPTPLRATVQLEVLPSSVAVKVDQEEDPNTASFMRITHDESHQQMRSGEGLLHDHYHHAQGQMTFVHRDGEVNVTFTTKTYDPSTHTCNLEGTVTDNDAEVGHLNIAFKADVSGFSLIDIPTGAVIFEEHAGASDIQTLVIENNNFVITGLEDHDDTAPELVDKTEYKGRTPSAIVHMGRGRMLESRSAHWQKVIKMRLTKDFRQEQHNSSQTFANDLKELLSDQRDNAILEMAVAFSNAGVNGGTYPCAFPLLSLAQQLRENAQSLSIHTHRDVRKKEEESAAQHGVSLLATDSSSFGRPACKGCSNSCGNKCFGLCGYGCSWWQFVCSDASPEKSYQGCCEHDGICGCGGMLWYECWSFQGRCSGWRCSEKRCKRCSSCSGEGRRRSRRRWWGGGQTLNQAMGRCTL